MQQRTLRAFILLLGTFVLLISTATAALSAERSPVQQANTPDATPLTQEALEQFWQEMYPADDLVGVADHTPDHTNVYTTELLAKASPDECFDGLDSGGIGPLPGFPTAQIDCPDGEQPKVNEAYVWGMTSYEDTIWFGTAPNVHCLVTGVYLGLPFPTQTDSYVCEYGQGPYPQVLPNFPDAIGDWRPPSVYIYDNSAEKLTDISPNDPLFNSTLGIRSAATFGDYVIFAGPALTPTDSINIFLYDAANRTFRGADNLTAYSDIRKWLMVDGVLYTAVGTADGGAVLRYTGNPASDDSNEWFQFETVGTLDTTGAELALHDGRIFVNTWPDFNLGAPDGEITAQDFTLEDITVAGLYMSPLVLDGELPESTDEWEKVFSYDEYEPDPVIARTYGGGALHSFQGDLFWGTMHVPFLATIVHLYAYEDLYATESSDVVFLSAMLGSQRSIAIFQGRDFDTPDQTVELAYGMPRLPAFDPNSYIPGDIENTGWYTPTNVLGQIPKYGFSGFDNLYNNYTWSMAEYDGQLFVGTMDWSYLLNDIYATFANLINELIFEEVGLPLELTITVPDAIDGADLYRFPTKDQPALPQSRSGVGNYTNYGVRNMVSREDGLYLGMANPMNLLTDPTDDKPEGGWELIRLTRHLIPVTMTVAGNGGGTVVSDPAGIDCGASCSSAFDYGSSVVLTPTADVGSTFTGWGDTCAGTDTCYYPSLVDPSAVTAIFTLDTHALTVGLAGDGSGSVVSDPAGINCGTACDELYNYGTTVTLTPTASAGSLFTGWDGACSGIEGCSVTIAETRHVTATFANNRFPLVVNLVGNGSGYVASVPTGIDCSQPSCSADFENDTVVSLSAIAFSGSSFHGWSGACTNSDTDACQVTIGPDTTVVTATFNQDPQATTLEVEGLPFAGAPITLTSTLNMAPINECNWDFGDGETEICDPGLGETVAAANIDAVQDVTIQTTHTYTQTGVYVVMVTATNDAGSMVAAQEITIQAPTAEEPVEQPMAPGDLYIPYVDR